MQQQAQKKYSNLFTIDQQHDIPRVNPIKINEYLSGLLLENFLNISDNIGVELKASIPRMTRTKRVLNQVNLLNGEMMVQILYNDSYQVACQKIDALTDYFKGKISIEQLRYEKQKWGK